MNFHTCLKKKISIYFSLTPIMIIICMCKIVLFYPKVEEKYEKQGIKLKETMEINIFTYGYNFNYKLFYFKII